MATAEARVIRAIQPFVQFPVTGDTLISETGMDSLAFMSAIYAVENEFGCDIRTEDFPKIRTIRDIASVISAQTADVALNS